MARVPGLIIQLTASPKGELLMCINDEPEGRDIDVRLLPETRLLYIESIFYSDLLHRLPYMVSFSGIAITKTLDSVAY